MSFGPSEVDGTHHRSPKFSVLLATVEDKFKKAFGLDDQWVVLFVTGSGTLANEIVLSSLVTMSMKVHHTEDEFAGRLASLVLAHYQPKWPQNAYTDAYVQYDTAASKFNEAPERERCVRVRFCDMVSSFPYYMPDPTVDVWTTVASKQLGCDPGLSMIVVRAGKIKHFRSTTEANSVLELQSYVRYHKYRQTPHTPAIGLLLQLRDRLDIFKDTRSTDLFRMRINARRHQLASIIPKKDIIGAGPVFTIRKGVLPSKLVAEWDLYQSTYGPQIYLWTGGRGQFNRFLKDLRKVV